MSPMQPIPETVEAFNNLDSSSTDPDLLTSLMRLADRAREVVPDLVGVSVARLDEGLTFTLLATAEEFAVLDGIQYAAGGPCVQGAHTDEILEFAPGDILDETRWQLFAAATAAHAVRSTLTLPVVTDGRVEGTVNLYAATRRAFVGHHGHLAGIFGAWAAGAVANADLPFSTRREAQAAPQQVRDQNLVDVAVGLLAAHLSLDVDSAEVQLRDAAARGGVSAAQLAGEIIGASEEPDGDDS